MENELICVKAWYLMIRMENVGAFWRRKVSLAMEFNGQRKFKNILQHPFCFAITTWLTSISFICVKINIQGVKEALKQQQNAYWDVLLLLQQGLPRTWNALRQKRLQSKFLLFHYFYLYLILENNFSNSDSAARSAGRHSTERRIHERQNGLKSTANSPAKSLQSIRRLSLRNVEMFQPNTTAKSGQRPSMPSRRSMR